MWVCLHVQHLHVSKAKRVWPLVGVSGRLGGSGQREGPGQAALPPSGYPAQTEAACKQGGRGSEGSCRTARRQQPGSRAKR